LLKEYLSLSGEADLEKVSKFSLKWGQYMSKIDLLTNSNSVSIHQIGSLEMCSHIINTGGTILLYEGTDSRGIRLVSDIDILAILGDELVAIDVWYPTKIRNDMIDYYGLIEYTHAPKLKTLSTFLVQHCIHKVLSTKQAPVGFETNITFPSVESRHFEHDFDIMDDHISAIKELTVSDVKNLLEPVVNV